MYFYELSVSMSDKELEFDEMLINALKQAIDETNSSISARRSGRVIEFVEQLTKTSVRLKMTSPEPLNPTRALSGVSRALLRNESDFLEGHLINGCVFSSRVIDQSTSNVNELDPVQLVQEVVSIVLGRDYLPDDKQRNLAKEASKDIEAAVLRYLDKIN